jgi:hypothetical protein
VQQNIWHIPRDGSQWLQTCSPPAIWNHSSSVWDSFDYGKVGRVPAQLHNPRKEQTGGAGTLQNQESGSHSQKQQHMPSPGWVEGTEPVRWCSPLKHRYSSTQVKVSFNFFNISLTFSGLCLPCGTRLQLVVKFWHRKGLLELWYPGWNASERVYLVRKVFWWVDVGVWAASDEQPIHPTSIHSLASQEELALRVKDLLDGTEVQSSKFALVCQPGASQILSGLMIFWHH